MSKPLQIELLVKSLLKTEDLIKNENYKESRNYIDSFFTTLKEKYPINAKRTMVSIHYSNKFIDENLRSIAVTLDEMNESLLILRLPQVQ